MIYKKDEFVQQDAEDREFPIKQVDRLEPLEGGECRFLGRAVLNMSAPIGFQQIPVSFEIEAETIEEAFTRYAEHARPKVAEVKQRVQERLDELQRQQGSRIVRPGGGAGENITPFNDLRRPD